MRWFSRRSPFQSVFVVKTTKYRSHRNAIVVRNTMPLNLEFRACGRLGREMRVRDLCVGVTDCTSSQSKTHSIESQEVRYRWHPWYGRTVWIHEDLEKNGEGIRRCRSENNINA